MCWVQKVYGISLPSSQFCCEHKTDLKKINYLKKKNTTSVALAMFLVLSSQLWLVQPRNYNILFNFTSVIHIIQ